MATANETMFDMQQVAADFGDCKPLAHTDGPSTSHEAVERHTKSGRRETHCQVVERLVRLHPRETSAELAERLFGFHLWGGRKIDLTELRRRLTDLKNQGRIVQGESRRCLIAQTSAVTWSINEEKQTWLPK